MRSAAATFAAAVAPAGGAGVPWSRWGVHARDGCLPGKGTHTRDADFLLKSSCVHCAQLVYSPSASDLGSHTGADTHEGWATVGNCRTSPSVESSAPVVSVAHAQGAVGQADLMSRQAMQPRRAGRP